MRAAVLLIVMGCVDSPADDHRRADAAVRHDATAAPDPIAPGEPCPTGTGCAGGVGCQYVFALDTFYCTNPCGDDGSCAGVGFDACCMPPPPMGQARGLCMATRLGLCAAADGGTDR